MKKIIALMLALVLVLSLTACFGTPNNGTSTTDQAKKLDVNAYKKDFEGLQKYIADNNSNPAKSELYYELLGADNGVRFIFNNNPYVEVYDFSKADNDTAKAILADIKDDGKFQPLPDGTEMTAVITASGKYVIAWDATRSYNYTDKVATDEVKANW